MFLVCRSESDLLMDACLMWAALVIMGLSSVLHICGSHNITSLRKLELEDCNESNGFADTSTPDIRSVLA